MTHQSPSPLCEVDKSSRADLPSSAGVGYETARSEDFNYGLCLAGEKTLKYKHTYIHKLTSLCMQLDIYYNICSNKKAAHWRESELVRTTGEDHRYLAIELLIIFG